MTSTLSRNNLKLEIVSLSAISYFLNKALRAHLNCLKLVICNRPRKWELVWEEGMEYVRSASFHKKGEIRAIEEYDSPVEIRGSFLVVYFLCD